MTTSSSPLGGAHGAATLARLASEFDAIAHQMSSVSADFTELKRLLEHETTRQQMPAAESAASGEPSRSATGPAGRRASPSRLAPPAVDARPVVPPQAPSQQVSTQAAPPMAGPTQASPSPAARTPDAPWTPDWGALAQQRQGPHPAYAPVPQRPPAPSPPRPATPPVSDRISAAVERGLIGKLLAVAGVGVTLIGVVLLLVLAAQAGILRPEFRVAGGALLAGALVGTSIWLQRKRDGRIGAVALAATGIAAGHLDVLAATRIYEWLPVVAGLTIAGVIAAAGLILASRWDSEHLGVLVIVPLIALAPVLTDGLDMTLIASMVMLAVASSWVQIGRDWIWLHTIRLAAPTVPLTMVGLHALGHERSAFTGLGFEFATATMIVVFLGFALAVVAMSTTRFPEAMAGLAAATTVPALFAGAVMGTAGAVSLLAVTALLVIGTTVVCATVRTERFGLPDTVAPIWAATALVLVFVALLVCFDGRVAVSVMLGLAIVTALMARTWSATSMVLLVGATLVWVVGFGLLISDMAPYVLVDTGLVESRASLAAVIGALFAAVGAIILADAWIRLTDRDVVGLAYTVAGVVAVYSVTAMSVTTGVLLAGADGFLGGHVAATTCWVAMAGGLLAYARRRRGGERTAAVTSGLVLVAAAMAKLFLFDLATLDGIFRVVVFMVTGLLLLGLGAWYARALHDDAEARPHSPAPNPVPRV
ncbi:DUF2339 domain-containing protein [Gordonia aurantiaca]|uniref:DUF2339 domain-containing protein n=1 Tax=Gordonia sp. B21 TaxID=3151852 RepID=UPI003267279A